MIKFRLNSVLIIALVFAPALLAAEEKLSGNVRIDGSSTVYPVTEAVAEEFSRDFPRVRVTVGISGTGGGFKKFCAGETEISSASRPIKTSEHEACSAAGIEYIELPVAYDAISVVVNKQNSWAESLTVADLKKIWEPEAQGKITNWKQVRESFPDRPIKLFGPGVDSGTYDYFTEAVMGKEDASRGDYTASEDDNVLVQGVMGETGALGFFGLGYFMENKERIKAVKIDNGAGPMAPDPVNVVKGDYQPLSRPLFIYVSRKAAGRAETAKFVEFYLNNAATLVKDIGYVELPANIGSLASRRFADRKAGSVFAGKASRIGVSLADLLSREGED